MLPTFIIAGAAKAGTTALWRHLEAHPEVCMARIKETAFFARQGPSARYSKGLVWYKSLYETCQRARARGEASPLYMVGDDSPHLIREIVPDVQLLFIFRDPVERLYSQYWFQRQQGQLLPEFEQMVQSSHPKMKRYINTSSYHIHLQRYLDVFPREQVSVFLLDDLRDDPQNFMRDVYETIDVNPEYVQPNLNRPRNKTGTVRVAPFQRILKRVGPIIMQKDLHPQLFTLLKKTRSTIWNLNTNSYRYPPIEPALRQGLVEEFEDAICYVERFLNRSLPAWRI